MESRNQGLGVCVDVAAMLFVIVGWTLSFWVLSYTVIWIIYHGIFRKGAHFEVPFLLLLAVIECLGLAQLSFAVGILERSLRRIAGVVLILIAIGVITSGAAFLFFGHAVNVTVYRGTILGLLSLVAVTFVLIVLLKKRE